MMSTFGTKEFALFTAECMTEPSVKAFAAKFELWAGGGGLNATDRINSCGLDMFKGDEWLDLSLTRFKDPNLQQMANQLAGELARQQPNNSGAVQKISWMLRLGWVQKNLRHWPSKDSLFETAIIFDNLELFAMLLCQIDRAQLTDGVLPGRVVYALEFAAVNGTREMFHYVLYEPKTTPSSTAAWNYTLRRCVNTVLRGSLVVGAGLGVHQTANLHTILNHEQLDRLPANIVACVPTTCGRLGCIGSNCNPLVLQLIEAGAPAEFPVANVVRMCTEQKNLIYNAMVDRATAFRTAFAMGLHPRLGKNSLIRHLDPGLVTAILEFAGPGKRLFPDPINRFWPQAPNVEWKPAHP